MNNQEEKNKAFIEKLNKINPNIIVESDYITAKTKVRLKCKKCGYEWLCTPDSLLHGTGCPSCAGNLRKTPDEFIAEMAIKQPTIKVLEQYKGARIPIKVSCLKCGHIWMASPTNLLKDRSCPKCSYKERGKKHRVNPNDFLKKASIASPELEMLGDYELSTKKILVRCKTCNYEWLVAPSLLLRGTGCPNCSHSGTSFVEQVILLCLRKVLNEEIVSRDRSVIKLELDIYIPSMKTAIEYGAWPWHKDKVEKDKKKFALCREKGIRLIEIFDAYDGPRIDNLDVWTIEENIGYKENFPIVKELVVRLCKELGVEYNLRDEELQSIQEEARINARRLTTERLNKILEEQGSVVRVLSDYHDALSKVHVECKNCGYQWDVIPASLLRGYGCPECSKKKKAQLRLKTREQFIEELKTKNPNIEVIGDYFGTHKKIKVRCKKHNITYTAEPNVLLTGSGCRKCLSEKISKRFLRDKNDYAREIEDKYPNIQLLSEYVNSRTKIKVRSKSCGHEWYRSADMLLNNPNCPICSRKALDESRKKTHKEYVDELAKINPSITVLSQYERSNKKIRVMCNKCNHEWEVIPTSLLLGYGCPNCAGNKRKTQEDFVREVGIKFPNLTVLGKYVNAKTKVKIKCNTCGNEFDVTPDVLIHRKKGCPKCKQ